MLCRYALQLVYYTDYSGPTHSPNGNKERIYNRTHSAIFQPNCKIGDDFINNYCINQRKYRTLEYDPDFDSRVCECNFRY